MTDENSEYLSISGLLKARAAQEGADRILYIEASNESTDLDGERVLAKSLSESADYFLKYGNIDLDHRTLRPQAAGDNPYLWEIGRPVEARIDGGRTFVKAVLYQGEGKMAENANLVWESLTQINPPARWYPSVGGQILSRGTEIDPLTKAKVNLITKVRWSNIGISRTPVNQTVPSVSTVPVEVFAKCCTAGGFNLSKALEAGYGTDVAELTGGAALGMQSLDRKIKSTYATAREQLAKRLRPKAIADEFGVDETEATQWVEQFLRDLITTREGSHP